MAKMVYGDVVEGKRANPATVTFKNGKLVKPVKEEEEESDKGNTPILVVKKSRKAT